MSQTATQRRTAVVIGSGPAGAAAVQALCDAGIPVTVLDAGDRIEAGAMDAFDRLARSEPDEWPPELLRGVRSAFPADVGRIPLKPAYGSLFPYVLDDPDLPLVNDGSEALCSHAFGGLSNAWGASVLPYRQTDIEDWPISLTDLTPHYRAVQSILPVAAERDELCRTLPLYTDDPGTLSRSRQAQRLLEHLRRHRPALVAAGFDFGASRLAVETAPAEHDRCRYSGMCLYGCPYRSIYNAAHTFQQLSASRAIDYRGGVHVDRLTEQGSSVVVDFHERRDSANTGKLIASRVFVACGAISSTRLVLNSLGRDRCTRRMLDSQYFVIPVLAFRGAPVGVAEQGNTLAQVFVELDGGHVTTRSVHLQVYGYNDIMLAALARRLSLPAAALERALRPLLGRLLVVQGFLHSADSPGLTVEYRPERVRVRGDHVGRRGGCVARLVRLLAAHHRSLGVLPLPRLWHVGRPGKSNHLGGSLPMRSTPGELETDMLGRPRGLGRIHVVDASVFPSIPATTITLSVMANAHRIATAAVTCGEG
jgi:choline dehydrogenase-like flavoprotein